MLTKNDYLEMALSIALWLLCAAWIIGCAVVIQLAFGHMDKWILPCLICAVVVALPLALALSAAVSEHAFHGRNMMFV